MLFMKLKERFLRILFPSRCIGCDRVISFGSDLCPSCAESLCKTEIDLADACKNCGAPKELCTCKNRAFEFDGAVSAFIYDGAVKNAVRTFKAKGNLQPADFLASRIVSAYSASGFPLPRLYNLRSRDQKGICGKGIQSRKASCKGGFQKAWRSF